MYYKCGEYTLIPYQYSKIELDFFDEIKKIIDIYPLKAYSFFEKIHDNEISYKRDSTLIISLLKLNKNDISNIFEILKRFLRVKAISKIFYKKEFVIVHFFNELILNVLKKEKTWMFVDYYFIIRKLLSNHVHFQGYLKSDNDKIFIDMFFYYNKKYYIFINDKLNINKNDNIVLCTLNQKEKNQDNREIKNIKYFLANTLKEEQVFKLVFTE